MAGYLDGFTLGQGQPMGGQTGLQMGAGGQGLQMPQNQSQMGLQQLGAQAQNIDPWGLMAMIDNSQAFGPNATKPGFDWGKLAQSGAAVKPFQPQGQPAPRGRGVRSGTGPRAPIPHYLPQRPISPVPSIGALIARRR